MTSTVIREKPQARHKLEFVLILTMCSCSFGVLNFSFFFINNFYLSFLKKNFLILVPSFDMFEIHFEDGKKR